MLVGKQGLHHLRPVYGYLARRRALLPTCQSTQNWLQVAGGLWRDIGPEIGQSSGFCVLRPSSSYPISCLSLSRHEWANLQLGQGDQVVYGREKSTGQRR